MWTYPDDITSPVITAREHIFAPHSGASAPEPANVMRTSRG